MQGSFLSNIEFNIIKKDSLDMLRSCEGLNATLHFEIPSSASFDEVYDRNQSETWTASSVSSYRCLQKIVNASDTELIERGILNVNDSILYFSSDEDFSFVEERSTMEFEIKGERWRPLPRNTKELSEYLATNLGPGEVWQVIPCKKSDT